MSILHSDHSIKTIGEALSFAECAVLNFYPDTAQRAHYARVLGDLLADVARQRPTGNDGKHGERHTPTCGCEDKGPLSDWRGDRCHATQSLEGATADPTHGFLTAWCLLPAGHEGHHQGQVNFPGQPHSSDVHWPNTIEKDVSS